MVKSRFLSGDLTQYQSTATIPEDMVGMISDDRSAVVGKNNWCFIYEGSNDYHNSYKNGSLLTLGEEWSRIIEDRQRFCDKLRIQFLQVVVPNKLTIVPEFFPESLSRDISYAFDGILRAQPDANLLAPVTDFRLEGVREAVFRRNDSHLTIAGNAYLFELVLNNLGLKDVKSALIETEQVAHVGDLGGKFMQEISEELYAPLWSKGLLDQQSVNKIKDVQSEVHNEVEQGFLNPDAPINKKIMVIGNSFCECVPSWGLSPLFTALFNEYYFMWSSDFATKAIKEFMPDIVIAQTCERFLTRLPIE